MRVYACVHDRLCPFGHTSVGTKYLVQASTKCTHVKFTCRQRKVTYRHFYHPCPLAVLSSEAEDGNVPGTVRACSLNWALAAEGGGWLRNEEQKEFWVLHVCHTQG